MSLRCAEEKWSKNGRYRKLGVFNNLGFDNVDNKELAVLSAYWILSILESC
jgi:hypothetical protein